MNTQPPPRSASEAMRRALGPQVSGALARGIAQGQQRAAEPAVSGVSSEEAAANVTAAVPMLAAAGLPAVEACTDPRHTGPIRAQLGCTGPDPAETVEQPTDGTEASEDAARRFARRLRAVELLCSGRPGYHVITVKALLTAMGEADEQPPAAFLYPFAEAAVRRGALLGGADAIEALPQDHECDPGRGDAVKLLRRLAGLTSTTEQPTGLTWEARADHAVRLYATTAIELEDARAEIGRLRAERAELIQQRDRIAHNTMAALTTVAEQRDNLDFNNGDTVAAVRDALLDPNEHTPETALAAARVLLAAHTRLLADEASERLTDRDAEMRADGYRGRVAWCSGMSEVVKLLGGRAAALAPAPAPQPDAAEEQPLAFPQLAVPCPRCEAPARQLCTSHNGTRKRTNDTHQDRTRAYRATQAGR
ncbi:zinc finger domain-containing protein [Streptomyces griseus]|uniref:zinc finger domain-containing protein n=1 Tax=Streptomyces griseus TaxID=1911 RepID=UPI0037A7C36A